jgi:hypothetical protein
LTVTNGQVEALAAGDNDLTSNTTAVLDAGNGWADASDLDQMVDSTIEIEAQSGTDGVTGEASYTTFDVAVDVTRVVDGSETFTVSGYAGALGIDSANNGAVVDTALETLLNNAEAVEFTGVGSLYSAVQDLDGDPATAAEAVALEATDSVDTFVYVASPTDAVRIVDFTVGADSDVLDVTAMTLEGTDDFATANAGSHQFADAKVIVLTAATGDVVADANTDIDTTGGLISDTVLVYVNGGNYELYRYTDDGNAAAVEAAEVELIGTLDSVAAGIVSDNFVS